jgi:hypothetical protein
MNQEVKQKWIAALRSGEYSQGNMRLKITEAAPSWADKHCCLGVLCEIGVKEGVIDGFNGANAYPPREITNWLGVEYITDVKPPKSDTPSLVLRAASWNDNEGLSFAQIAGRLEVMD